MPMLIDGGASRHLPPTSHQAAPRNDTPPPKRAVDASAVVAGAPSEDRTARNQERLSEAARNTQQKMTAAAHAQEALAQLESLPPAKTNALRSEIEMARRESARADVDASQAVLDELAIAKDVLSPAHYEDYKGALERDFEHDPDRKAVLATALAKQDDDDLQDSVEVLNRDFETFDTAARGGGADNFVSHNDLKAVRDGAQYSQEQRAAAVFLLANTEHLNAMDTAAQGGETDGIVSRNDLTVYAIQHPEAIPDLKESTVPGSATNPTILHIDAKAPAGAAWGNAGGNNAGIVSIYVDGKYFADATIFSENPAGVDINLGVLGAGNHKIELRDTSNIGTNNKGPGVTNVSMSTKELNINARDPAERDAALAARHAPIVHLERNGQAVNNTPLFTTARITHNGNGTTSIEYRVLYSNEDGGHGADPGKLADYWGRTTDDEYIYTVTVNDKTGQAVSVAGNGGIGKGGDALREFNDPQQRVNDRPVITIVDDHNKVDWASDHEYRAKNRAFSGAPLIVNGMTTLDVMNENPWTWEVTTKEIAREGESAKLNPYDRIYINLQDGSGADLRDVKAITVTLKDGRVEPVPFSGWDRNSRENKSVTLPQHINAEDIVRVEFEGLRSNTDVQVLRIDKSTNRPKVIQE